MNKFFDFINNIKLLISLKKEHSISRILFNYSLKIATAESCTGGLLSSRLTDISGSSSYTKANFVTYSNESKMELLGVKEETLQNFGAVSEECALEMAEGLYKKTDCDIAISTTGIAGPTSPESGKPVGLIYIAIKNNYTQKCQKFNINPKYSRKRIKFLFTQKAFDFLKEFLEENYLTIKPQLSESTNQDNP